MVYLLNIFAKIICQQCPYGNYDEKDKANKTKQDNKRKMLNRPAFKEGNIIIIIMIIMYIYTAPNSAPGAPIQPFHYDLQTLKGARNEPRLPKLV